MSYPVKETTVYNIDITLADTEYPLALPSSTREIRFRCRTLFDIRYSFTGGKVAVPTSPWLVLPAGSDYYSDNNDLTAKTIYFACGNAGKTVELEIWT